MRTTTDPFLVHSNMTGIFFGAWIPQLGTQTPATQIITYNRTFNLCVQRYSIFSTPQKLCICNVCLTLTFDIAAFEQLNVSSIRDQANSAAF